MFIYIYFMHVCGEWDKLNRHEDFYKTNIWREHVLRSHFERAHLLPLLLHIHVLIVEVLCASINLYTDRIWYISICIYNEMPTYLYMSSFSLCILFKFIKAKQEKRKQKPHCRTLTTFELNVNKKCTAHVTMLWIWLSGPPSRKRSSPKTEIYLQKKTEKEILIYQHFSYT